MHQSCRRLNSFRCEHAHKANPEGLALITIGNSLKSDDGIASALCDQLPKETLVDVCRFDLGTYTGFLSDCLAVHKVALIIDATHNGIAPGTVTILDLASMLGRSAPLHIGSCHGISIADELRLAQRQGKIPIRLIFFGIEVVPTVDWAEQLSSALKAKLPDLSHKLALLVKRIVETLKERA